MTEDIIRQFRNDLTKYFGELPINHLKYFADEQGPDNERGKYDFIITNKGGTDFGKWNKQS